jgi:hypothetical protein
LVAAGRDDRARTVLEAAADRFPDDVALASMRADLAIDRAAALGLLVDAVERTHDPTLLARARALAEALDDTDALESVLRGPRPLPPLTDEVSEEIVVVAKDSAARLKDLIVTMEGLGYRKPPVRRGNGDLHFAMEGIAQPAVTLHADGSFDVQESGLVKVKQYPWLDRSPTVLRPISGKKLSKYRATVFDALTPELIAWRAALCTEALEDRLLEELPATLDAVWRQGVDRDGSALATPQDRRAALLDWWVTRTCTAEGEAVRRVIARYLAREVQTSPWPVTEVELAAVNDSRPCDGVAALAFP